MSFREFFRMIVEGATCLLFFSIFILWLSFFEIVQTTPDL